MRPSRRLTIALLWLAIALMPLRGLAGGWMTAATEHEAGIAVALADASSPPCHGDGVDDAATPAACSLCDLCHSAAAQLPAAPTLPVAAHEPQPVADAACALEGRAPDALFRPPRSDLA